MRSSNNREDQRYAAAVAAVFTLLTPLSLTYPAILVIAQMNGVGLNRTVAAEWSILLGLPLVGAIVGPSLTFRRPPAARFAMAAVGAFTGSLFVWATGITFFLYALSQGPFVF